MTAFDEAFIESICGRMAAIPADAEPRWGRLRPRQMFAHLGQALAYSLGEVPETANEGGFLGRYIAKPLILHGVIKLPRNAKAPRMYDFDAPESSLDALRSKLEAYRATASRDGFAPPPHPYFGPLTGADWSRLHIIHCDHHARQFGV